MMDRLLVLTLIWMFSVPCFGSVDNFQELIASTSTEQTQAYQGVVAATSKTPAIKVKPQVQKESQFKIRLIRKKLAKRTMVAKAR